MEKLLRQGRFNSGLLTLMFLFQGVAALVQGQLFGLLGLAASLACGFDTVAFHQELNKGSESNEQP